MSHLSLSNNPEFQRAMTRLQEGATYPSGRAAEYRRPMKKGDMSEQAAGHAPGSRFLFTAADEIANVWQWIGQAASHHNGGATVYTAIPTTSKAQDVALPEGAKVVAVHGSLKNIRGNLQTEQMVVFEHGDMLVAMNTFNNHLWYGSWSPDPLNQARDADFAVELLKDLPPVVETDDKTISMSFWFDSSGGPKQTERSIAIDPWEAIDHNYPTQARQGISDIIKLDPNNLEGSAGKFFLMHGPPGTGKTTAIRALAAAWSKWCEVEFIVDPEVCFGGNTSYLMHVLLHGSSDEMTLSDGSSTNKWRLFIVEDADEFISANAKERTGQALSRLLNIGDGLIGQGLKILLLFTTNVEIGKLHPALTRPGRCMANVHVPAMTPAECAEWAKSHDFDFRPTDGKTRTLAEMYAELGNHGPITVAAPASTTKTGEYL